VNRSIKVTFLAVAALSLLFIVPQVAGAAVTLTSPTTWKTSKPAGSPVTLTGSATVAGDVAVIESPWPYKSAKEKVISERSLEAGEAFTTVARMKFNARYRAVLTPSEGGADQQSKTVGVWRTDAMKSKCKWDNYTDGRTDGSWKANFNCTWTGPKEVVAALDNLRASWWIRKSDRPGWRRLGHSRLEADGTHLYSSFGFWNSSMKIGVWAWGCFNDAIIVGGERVAPYGSPSKLRVCPTKQSYRHQPKMLAP
jgi:hypothetical protein